MTPIRRGVRSCRPSETGAEPPNTSDSAAETMRERERRREKERKRVEQAIVNRLYLQINWQTTVMTFIIFFTKLFKITFQTVHFLTEALVKNSSCVCLWRQKALAGCCYLRSIAVITLDRQSV